MEDGGEPVKQVSDAEEGMRRCIRYDSRTPHGVESTLPVALAQRAR